MTHLLPPAKAREIVLGQTRTLPAVQVSILESLDRILAEDVVSGENIPPFNNSAMDGFAVLAGDIQGASADKPVELKIIDNVPAGKVSGNKVTSGTAIKIMTGAQIPEGADAVVRMEDTGQEEDLAYIFCEIHAGQNIRLSGEDIKKDEVVLRHGSLITPAEIGVMASLGKSRVGVIRQPKVAVLATGDELVETDEPLSAGKIRNSNSYTLFGQVLACKAQPVMLGIARDKKEELEAKIREGLKVADVILTTGGVSVGEHDFVKDVLAEIGADLKFWGVAQKPGKPLAFWTLGEKLIFGLPGNPVAVMVTFEEYVRPALLKMMGRMNLFRPEVEASLTHERKKKSGRAEFIRVKIENLDGKHYATSTGAQGSGILKSMTLANGLAVIPAETKTLKAGDLVKVHLIDMPEDH
jgi:molybdopterin molybdotransferase